MQMPGLGKKKTDKDAPDATPKSRLGLKDLKQKVRQWQQLASHYQTTIIALAVALLLAVTALRMLRYMDPPADDNQVQKNLSKFKQIRIDSKTVQKIKQLQDTGSSTSPKLENGRSNPFAE